MMQDRVEEATDIERLCVLRREALHDRVMRQDRIGEPTPKPRNHVVSRCPGVGHDPDRVFASEEPLMAEDLLYAPVVLLIVKQELARRVVERPSGKGSRSLLDVSLGVVPDTHREALHELSREVLVGMCSEVASGVEPDQHRWILRNSGRQRLERSCAQLSKDLVLVEEQARIDHLGERCWELAVQQEYELFSERSGSRRHQLDPPIRQRQELTASLRR